MKTAGSWCCQVHIVSYRNKSDTFLPCLGCLTCHNGESYVREKHPLTAQKKVWVPSLSIPALSLLTVPRHVWYTCISHGRWTYICLSSGGINQEACDVVKSRPASCISLLGHLLVLMMQGLIPRVLRIKAFQSPRIFSACNFNFHILKS